MKITTYAPEVEAQMRNFYHSLSEKDRRRYAAVEAAKLGHGGITYLCQVLHCDEGTVSRGLKELKMPLLKRRNVFGKQGVGESQLWRRWQGWMKLF
ncbi:hypothetical protein [Nitrosomonas sp. PLL12-2]|nr:hypothetical protein [Nitrosomonas sp. PLL12-2]